MSTSIEPEQLPSSDPGHVRSSLSNARSIGSIGSFCSIGSIGSAFSIGSIGSFCSIGSIGSAFSIGSMGSFASILSVGAAGGLLIAGAQRRYRRR